MIIPPPKKVIERPCLCCALIVAHAGIGLYIRELINHFVYMCHSIAIVIFNEEQSKKRSGLMKGKQQTSAQT